MEDLSEIVEGALYVTIRELNDKKSIVMDPETEKLYYKKTLKVYSVPVFRYLKEHQNPALPRIKTFWREEGNLVVIEELIQGSTLLEYLEEHDVSFEEKKRILLEICDGLIFLHSAEPPIIHRDIKATNIMITDDGKAVIIDYDAAKQYVQGSSKDTVLIGTQGNAAPEQYGFAQSDQRTDIYAFGKMIEKVMPESPRAMEVARRATIFNPASRYQTVRQMKNEIEKLWDPKISTAEHYKDKAGEMVHKKTFKLAVALVILIILAAVGKRFFDKNIYPEYFVRKPAYEAAVEAMKAGDYEKAVEKLDKCGHSYKDSADLYQECLDRIYEKKQQKIKDTYLEDFNTAVDAFRGSGQTDDEIEMISRYQTMTNAGLDGNYNDVCYDAAIYIIKKNLDEDKKGQAKNVLTVFSDKTKRMKGFDGYTEKLRYEFAGMLCDKKEYGDAREQYLLLGEYEDSAKKAEESMDEMYNYYIESDQLMSGYQYFDDLYTKHLSDDHVRKLRKELSKLVGERFYRDGEYYKAIQYFRIYYADKTDKARLYDAEYMYCVENMDKPDNLSKQYMEQLVEMGYPGAADLKNGMDTWKINVWVENSGQYQVIIHVECSRASGGTLEYNVTTKFTDGAKYTYNATNTNATKVSNGLYSDMYNYLSYVGVYDLSGNLLAEWTH
ncbi:MAG: protein kinase [Eubacterium sp.]|nr:protein kinase [Eubacterium sp.]